MQKIKLQVKETESNLLTIDELFAYNIINLNTKYNIFYINAAKEYLKTKNIDIANIKFVGDKQGDLYYPRHYVTKLRDATPFEEIAYYVDAIIYIKCSGILCDDCLNLPMCNALSTNAKNIRELLKGKEFVVTVIEGD